MTNFVMVIDDSLVVRVILDTCLRRAGYDVKCFEDGLQALGWLNTSEACIPDLILVDLGLPRLDGYEIIRLLRARPALVDTVLLILSARRHPGPHQGAAGRRARLPHQALQDAGDSGGGSGKIGGQGQ